MAKLDKSFFTTSKLPAEQRMAMWEESISTIFDIDIPRSASEQGFNASVTSFLLNEQIMFTQCETKSQGFSRSSLRTAQDGMDYYLVQTHLKGHQDVHRAGKNHRCESGDLLVIDLADVHAAEAADFSHLTLVIPRPLLAPHLAQPDSQEGRVLKGDNGLTTLAVNHMKTLAQVIGNMNQDEIRDVIEPTLLLLASSLNGTVDSVEQGSGGVVQSYLSRAKLIIEKNLQQDFNIDWLCKQVSISRAGLYRLFAPLGGVKSYIQERRLRKCTEQLLSPRFAHLPIYDIAARWGFHNESYFSRAFKHRYGLTPRAARSARKIDKNSTPFTSEQDFGDRYYEQWLTSVLKS